ncbi:MAG: alpha/beta fold hydrolase [Sulfuritalea sp.]|jgi:pimeloyl-ACP methyl ester carboxylesterase|nr:alpha/beta fold hydrolase [Sulfuritalea sp.]
MAARQLRWLLCGELLGYLFWGYWLASRCGWSSGEVAWLVAGFMFGVRLLFVLTTFALARPASDPLPPAMCAGPLGAVRMVIEEYIALCLLFTVVQPFERFWLGPDRLAHCAARPTPLLLIHGYQCNRGFWFWLRRKLEAAGWTVGTHSLEPVFGDIDGYVDGIARRIDEVLAATGAPQVILVGHSMGGLASRAYLRRHGTARVARLITLGTPHQGTQLARLGLGPNARQMRLGSPWLGALAAPLPPASVSIYSVHDNYVYPQQACSTLEGASGAVLVGVGHLGMAISPRVLRSLLAALETSA